MERDEIALRLITAELSNPNSKVFLSNPRPLTWTMYPPPGIYILVDNALWMADYILDIRHKNTQHDGEKQED